MGLTSCEDMLNVDPKQSVKTEEALNSYDAAEAVLFATYDRFQNGTYYGRDFIIQTELLSDNLKINSSNSNRFTNEQYNYAGSHVGIWGNCYIVINRANNILAKIDSFTNPNDVEFDYRRDHVKAEALFLRALAYFDLIRAYGREYQYNTNAELGVPIVTKVYTLQEQIEFPARNTVKEVYDFIENDLATAKTLMINAETKTGIKSYFPYRVTSPAISAFQSRVFLYQNKWDEASAAATEAIATSGLSLVPGDQYVKIFKDDAETIFGLRWKTENESLGYDCLASIQNQKNGDGYGDAILRADMVNQFAPITKVNPADPATWTSPDYRWSIIQYGKRNGSGSYIPWNIKFNSWKGSFGMDNITLFRLSELYLTVAEAEANKTTPDEAAALTALNKIHKRAGLPDLVGLTGDALKNAILKERRIELAFEGHRFWDLKRKQLPITKGTATDYSATGEASVAWNDYRVVARIPIGETDINKNLKQNPGY